MDNEDTHSNFVSEVLNLCYQENNKKNILDRSLLEKIWLMRNYLLMANRCYKTKSYFNASIIYGEALDLLNTDQYPDEYKLTDGEQLELKYAYCLALLSSDDADCISKALDYLKDLVVKHGKSCPVFYLSLGSVYYKLTQYDKCVDVLTQGLKYTSDCKNKRLSLPFTDKEYLADTNSAELSGKMRDLLADSRIARQPDMKCHYGGCAYAGNIFIDNPTFPGYINIKCSDSCSFTYHLSCWRIKKKIIFKKSGKVDILKMECGTPDCEGILCEITVYNGKCNVKSTRKIKVDSKKTVSKDKENSVLQSPQCGTINKVIKGAASKTNANDKVTEASQQNKANGKTKEVACKDDENLPQSVSHEDIIALPIPSKISKKTSWTQTKTSCKTVEVQCCSEKETIGTQTTTAANTGKKKFKNCSTNTDAVLNISSTGSCKNCKEANKNCKKLESENKQMASELENLKLELQKEKERFAYAQDTSKNIVNSLLEHVKRAQSEQIEKTEDEEKQQARVRFLNNVLVEQIQHNQNVYNTFYTLYKDKCKRMLWDLNDVLQLVRFESVPSKVEIEMSIKHWDHAVSQICNCQNHVMKYFDNLLKLLATQDSYGEIKPQQLPDLPSEPPNLLNSYFKVLVNMNNTILNSIAVPIQTRTQSQVNQFVGLPLTSNQVIVNPGYPHTNFYPNVVRPSPVRYPMSSPVAFPVINKTGGEITSTEPNVPYTSKGIQNSKSENGVEVNQNEKSSLVTTEEFNEAKNSFSTSEATQMRTKEKGTETVCSKSSLNTTTKPDESDNFTTVARKQRKKKEGAAVDQNSACSNEKPEASPKELEQISRSEKKAQVPVTLVLSLKKYFPDVPNGKLVEAVTALKNRRNKLSGTRMSEIAEEVKLILMSMVVESYSDKNITNAEQQTWCKIESGLKKWHPENVDLNCSICFEELNTRPTLELLCLHLFHKHCIKQWLQNNSICPICRTYIVLDDEFPPLSK